MAIRSVSDVIKGTPTLEGGVFGFTGHFLPAHCLISIHSFCSTKWGQWMSGPEKPKALRIIRTAASKP